MKLLCTWNIVFPFEEAILMLSTPHSYRGDVYSSQSCVVAVIHFTLPRFDCLFNILHATSPCCGYLLSLTPHSLLFLNYFSVLILPSLYSNIAPLFINACNPYINNSSTNKVLNYLSFSSSSYPSHILAWSCYRASVTFL